MAKKPTKPAKVTTAKLPTGKLPMFPKDKNKKGFKCGGKVKGK